MINSLKYASLSISMLLLASTGHAQTALRGGFVENADVFVYMDVTSLNNSAFSKAVEELKTPEDKALEDELQAKFTAATGLTEDDVLSAVFSMDIDDIDFQAQDPAVLETAQAVAAIELAKAITLEQAKAGIENMAQENEVQPTVTIAEVDGLQVLKLESPQAEQGPDQAFGTLSPDGKTVLFAFNTLSLKDGLARIAAEKTAAPTADMGTAMQAIGKRQARMVLVLPPVARQKIQEGIQATAAQGGMGAMLMPFSTAKSLIISANTADDLNFYLSLDLGNAGNATQAAGMVQSMLPMLMMGLGPQAAELSQKIQIAPKESVVTVSITLSPADIQKIAEMADEGEEVIEVDAM
ncbi:hypothetical protein P3T73_14060 [Kiritimatiellota bacterium B12222]|nr:hypothetical protein P3T73_14060 [Kiritimatiellota bacterium B12222]